MILVLDSINTNTKRVILHLDFLGLVDFSFEGGLLCCFFNPVSFPTLKMKK